MTAKSPSGDAARAMADTGRLREGLSPRTARLVFGATADADIDTELRHITAVDEAHLIMLVERNLIRQDQASALLKEIANLRAIGFAPLRGKQASRGVYTLYENYLISELGPDVGGVLHTGRSRNDLKATVHQLRLREPVARLLTGLLRLQGVLLGRGRAHMATVMPAYSQFQPALPATYGYYLLGIASALDRDIGGLLQTCAGLWECPLGAASGAGTDVPIDPARTARLLGFTEPVRHAGYSVASRDVMVRLMSAGTLAGLTLSRLATDLQLWSTLEFGLLQFPDSLVGASSAMPQKRNPFLLEHIKGGAGALIGSLMSMLANLKNTPFGNSIEVSTEGIGPIWSALERLDAIVQLATCVVAGARPVPEAMVSSADRGFTVATSLANRLVARAVPFRVAHRAVGRLVTELTSRGVGSLIDVDPNDLGALLQRILHAEGIHMTVDIDSADLDPGVASAAMEFGGGPGPAAFCSAHEQIHESWRGNVRKSRARWASFATAEEVRRQAVRDLVSSAEGAV